MKTAITLRRLAVAALTATAIGVGPVGHIVDAGRTGPEVTERIDVEEGNKVFLVGHAIGVQIYGCKTVATGFGWELIAPRADLYGDNGKLIVTHYGGPTWQAPDGSAIVGEVRARANAADPRSIPLLLLNVKASNGNGLFSKVRSIQRLETVGGIAPAEPCTAQEVTRVARVPYTATYYMFVERP